MATYTVELTTDQASMLRDIAEQTNRSEASLCAEAVARYIEARRHREEAVVHVVGGRRISMNGIAFDDTPSSAVNQYVAPDEEP